MKKVIFLILIGLSLWPNITKANEVDELTCQIDTKNLDIPLGKLKVRIESDIESDKIISISVSNGSIKGIISAPSTFVETPIHELTWTDYDSKSHEIRAWTLNYDNLTLSFKNYYPPYLSSDVYKCTISNFQINLDLK